MKTALVACLSLICLAAVQDKGGKVAWKDDPKAAMEEAKKTGKPMMLYFTSQG